MKTANLLLGFAFVGFGFKAISLISELRDFVGQELLGSFLFFIIGFILSFIAWFLSYVLIKEGYVKTSRLEKLARKSRFIKGGIK